MPWVNCDDEDGCIKVSEGIKGKEVYSTYRALKTTSLTVLEVNLTVLCKWTPIHTQSDEEWWERTEEGFLDINHP